MAYVHHFKSAALAALLAAGASSAALAQKSLTIALPANVNTLDPHNTASVGTDLSVISHLHATLIERQPDMMLKGQLASEWKAVNDTTWRFSLRAGASFSNGEPLDAEAVKWNIDRVMDPKMNSRLRPWFSAVKEIKVNSPTEIDIITNVPHPSLPDQLSMFYLLPPKWSAGNNPATAAVGAGPYELKQFITGDRVVLTARADWFGAKPAYDTVTFRVIPEAGARIAALLAGEADFITNVPPSEMKRIDASGKAKAGAVDSARSVFVKYNVLTAPMKDNVKLRQALNHAVDRTAIRDAIWNGMGSVSTCQVLTPAYFGYNPDLKPHAYDAAKAKALLKDAGIAPGGLTIEFEVPVGPYLLAQDIVQAVAGQLEEVGVKTKIIEMEFGAWMNKYLRAANMGQMAYLAQAWPTLDADGLLSLFEAGTPYAYWDDKPYSDLLKQARSTTNPETRKGLYKQATERMCDQAPILFLFTQPATYATSTRVKWQARGDDWVRASDFTAP